MAPLNEDSDPPGDEVISFDSADVWGNLPANVIPPVLFLVWAVAYFYVLL